MSVFFTRRGEAHSLGKLASDYAVGESVFLMENGSPIEYIVVHHGLPSSMYDASCDGTWLLRKNIWQKQRYDYNHNDYLDGEIQIYLIGSNASILTTFSKEVQEALVAPKIPYVEFNSGGVVKSGSNGLKGRVFLLSGYEVGFTTDTRTTFPEDGTCLDYFKGTSTTADSKRIATFSGEATTWWLRSFPTNTNSNVFAVTVDGDTMGYTTSSMSPGIRPTVIVNSETLFDSNTNVIMGLKNPPAHDTFNIDGVYYRVDAGMTWYQWVNSDYNVDRFEANSKSSDGTYKITTCTGANIQTQSGTDLIREDVIRVGGTYKFCVE